MYLFGVAMPILDTTRPYEVSRKYSNGLSYCTETYYQWIMERDNPRDVMIIIESTKTRLLVPAEWTMKMVQESLCRHHLGETVQLHLHLQHNDEAIGSDVSACELRQRQLCSQLHLEIDEKHPPNRAELSAQTVEWCKSLQFQKEAARPICLPKTENDLETLQ